MEVFNLTDSNYLFSLIKIISEKMEQRVNQGLRALDITYAQSRCILYIYQQRECTMKDLEQEFEVSQQTMMGIVNRLEKKRLLKGYTDCEDRRVKKVALTNSGHLIAQQILTHIHENETKLVTSFSEEELNELVHLLTQLKGTL